MKPHDTLPYTELPDYSDAERIARSEAFYQAIKSRRTCRYFTDEAIPRAVIENAIRAAGTAPNGANHQPWHFAVIETPEKKKALRAAAEEEERAFYESKGSEEWLEALAPLGTDADKPFLETTLTHTPNPMKFLNQLCDRPANEKPMMVLVVGKPAPGATIPVHATIKKPLDQIASWL